MPHTTTSPTRLRSATPAEQDAWDDDALEDEETGPNWTKVYVGGGKMRAYAAVVTPWAQMAPPGPPVGTQQPARSWL